MDTHRNRPAQVIKAQKSAAQRSRQKQAASIRDDTSFGSAHIRPTVRHWDAVVDELMGAPLSIESCQLQRLYVAFEVGSGGAPAVRQDSSSVTKGR